jgi:hypothetical protein
VRLRSIAIIGGIGILSAALLASRTSSADREIRLSDKEMASLVGGDSCSDCGYGGERFDECAQELCADDCSRTKCFANYIIDSTCINGMTGVCSGRPEISTARSITYVRECENCTSVNSGFQIVTTHFYGSDCTTENFFGNCLLQATTCDGTLLSASPVYPGIKCN